MKLFKLLALIAIILFHCNSASGFSFGDAGAAPPTHRSGLFLEEDPDKSDDVRYYIYEHEYWSGVAILITVLLIVFIIAVIKLCKRNKELEAKKNEMSHLNKVQSRVLSVIGHDLRGPLGNIYELFKLYSDKDMKLKEDDIIPLMKECAGQVGAAYLLAENILLWAKNQSSGIKTTKETYSLTSIITETVRLFEQPAKGKGVILNVESKGAQHVMCDYTQISSVLRNLVSNAVKYTNSNDTITLSSKRINKKVEFKITDSGIGLEQDKLAMLLDSHSSFSTPGTKNEPGTGLGFSLIVEFVEKNGGKLTGTSQVGKGTSFSFSLPIGSEKD